MTPNSELSLAQIARKYPNLLADIQDKNPTVPENKILEVLYTTLYYLDDSQIDDTMSLLSSFVWSDSMQGQWFWQKVDQGKLDKLLAI